MTKEIIFPTLYADEEPINADWLHDAGKKRVRELEKTKKVEITDKGPAIKE